MANKVKFGASNLHVATFETDEAGVPTYATPVAVPGLVSMSLEAQGDELKFYADNKVYYSRSNNAGYEATLTCAKLTDFIRTQILGQQKDDNGAILEHSDDKPKDFALIYQVEGDEANTRYVLYNCSMSRPGNEDATTEDGIEVATDEVTITISERHDRLVKAILEEDNPKYSTAFTEVYEPVVTPTP